MNPYVKNLNRLEFLLTHACTEQCKHCSEGEHGGGDTCLDAGAAAEAVEAVAPLYDIRSVMTFGGEPLLHPQGVWAIHRAARDAGIPKRQLITNGYFSRKTEAILHMAGALAQSGVNDVLLSVDAFHQETIPLASVMTFARAVHGAGIRLRAHPAWLVGAGADNPYNNKTRDILAIFSRMGIEASPGNVIFPGGNALKYLGAYFDTTVTATNPYTDDPLDIRSLCVLPDGDVLGGNIYNSALPHILERYTPEAVI